MRGEAALPELDAGESLFSRAVAAAVDVVVVTATVDDVEGSGGGCLCAVFAVGVVLADADLGVEELGRCARGGMGGGTSDAAAVEEEEDATSDLREHGSEVTSPPDFAVPAAPAAPAAGLW